MYDEFLEEEQSLREQFLFDMDMEYSAHEMRISEIMADDTLSDVERERMLRKEDERCLEELAYLRENFENDMEMLDLDRENAAHELEILDMERQSVLDDVRAQQPKPSILKRGLTAAAFYHFAKKLLG